MIRSLFLSKQELDKLARRPVEPEPFKVSKLGILGAGLMGCGIAYVSALAGMEVILIDTDQAAADAGRDRTAALLEGAAKKGRLSPHAAASRGGPDHAGGWLCASQGL